MLNADNVAGLLEQALLAVPMFQIRWRWNLTRALVVLRQQNGKRVPPHMLRFRCDDLMAAVFPETVGCLENHSGDVKIPDHPLVRQTMHDCLHEALDLDGLVALLKRVRQGQVRFVARDTREPSPFSYELLNANPYAFLDGAPLEERRVRAVATRRTISVEDMRDLARLDPEAVAQVRTEAWPLVRSADELHDALLNLVTIDALELRGWQDWLHRLVGTGRATRVVRSGHGDLWIAAENWPILRAAFPEAEADPPVELPDALQRDVERTDAWIALVRGRIEHCGPATAARIGGFLGLDEHFACSALEALEGQGTVMRGNFTQPARDVNVALPEAEKPSGETVEWCDRRLLARIHRLTLHGLRQQIRPVEPRAFLDFLTRHHRLVPDSQWGGAVGVREAISQLQGFELPAGAWEARVLAARVSEYDAAWLDHLFLSGEVLWGRVTAPRRDDQRPSMAALTRVVPISFWLREQLSTLIAPDRTPWSGRLRAGAQSVLDALTSRGALFPAELKSMTQLLPDHLDEAVRELAALGLITSDAFAAVRRIADGKRSSRSRRRGNSAHAVSAPVGRWSLFPGSLPDVSRDEYLDAWCHQLLRCRYGVVFRDLLARETAAPRWPDLVATFRRLELRGAARGGRFVSGVAGEQYALPEAIDLLRQSRERIAAASDEPWIAISAADPVNLFGVLTDDPRVVATHRNALIIQAGRLIASRQAGQAEFHETVDQTTAWEMRRAMTLGRRPELPADGATASDRFLRKNR